MSDAILERIILIMQNAGHDIFWLYVACKVFDTVSVFLLVAFIGWGFWRFIKFMSDHA